MRHYHSQVTAISIAIASAYGIAQGPSGPMSCYGVRGVVESDTLCHIKMLDIEQSAD